MNEIGFSAKVEGALELAQKIKTLPVTNPQQYAFAGEQLAVIREREKQLEKDWDDYLDAIEFNKNRDIKTSISNALKDARVSKKKDLDAFDQEQDRIRLAEEARISAELKARSEEEALKLAQMAQDAGNTEMAAQVLEQAISAPNVSVVLPKATPKVKGVSFRTVKRWTVTTKSGKTYKSENFTAATRISMADLSHVPAEWLMLNPMAVSAEFELKGKAAERPGFVYREERV